MQRAIVLVACIMIGCSSNNNSNTCIGSEFVGTTYINNSLGEGVAQDNDPLIRYDAFDCVTFVETVLADGNVDKLNKIRYHGEKPDFIQRNHFIETDWLENNSQIVQNVSRQYAETQTRNVIIDKQKWFKIVHNIDTVFAPQSVNMEYIPYDKVRGIKISEPMIVLFIIDNKKIRDKIGTDLAVRHMGLLLPDGRLRHASRRAKQVVDTDFNEYINRIVEKQNNLGIMLLEIKK